MTTGSGKTPTTGVMIQTSRPHLKITVWFLTCMKALMPCLQLWTSMEMVELTTMRDVLLWSEDTTFASMLTISHHGPIDLSGLKTLTAMALSHTLSSPGDLTRAKPSLRLSG